MDQEWLNNLYFENEVRQYLLFLGIILAGLLFKRIVSYQFSGLLYRFVKRYVAGAEVRQLQDLLHKPFSLFIVLISFYIACKQLHYPESWHLPTEENFGIRFFIWRTFQLSIIISISWIILRWIDFFGIVLAYRIGLRQEDSDEKLVPFIREALKILVVILTLFFCLGAVFEVNVASLIAGLGIGGIALALAAKETLENLMASFTIFLDKPFATGDLVKVGQVKGSVEKIGFRSTQIRTFDRTVFSVPNKKMIDVELENISLRNMIRAKFTVLIKFETPVDKIENFRVEALNFMKGQEYLSKENGPIVHIENMSDFGIEMQFVFFVETVDFAYFMEKREIVFLKIIDIAQKENIKLGSREIPN